MMTEAFIQNAADPKRVKEAARNERWTRDQEVDDVRAILALRNGRRFIWRYLELCGVFKTSFTGSSETFFREGQRNVGLKLLADISDADPQAYVTMLNESKGVNSNG